MGYLINVVCVSNTKAKIRQRYSLVLYTHPIFKNHESCQFCTTFHGTDSTETVSI